VHPEKGEAKWKVGKKLSSQFFDARIPNLLGNARDDDVGLYFFVAVWFCVFSPFS